MVGSPWAACPVRWGRIAGSRAVLAVLAAANRDPAADRCATVRTAAFLQGKENRFDREKDLA